MQRAVARAPGVSAGAIGGLHGIATARRLLAMALAVIGITAVAAFGTHYWKVGRFLVATDDAYVQADSITIAPRIAGYIAEVAVSDNQAAIAGQLLARIDDRDLRTALDQATAGRRTAENNIANIAAQLETQQAAIDEAAA
jgi:membrane fusion protein (multidrug efflux system)